MSAGLEIFLKKTLKKIRKDFTFFHNHVTMVGNKIDTEDITMDDRFSKDSLEYLYRGILSLQTVKECADFFEDLCTPSELSEMSRRMQAARMLKNGYIYSDIAEETGLSTATISRVNRCLKYGADGYLTALERLERERKRG